MGDRETQEKLEILISLVEDLERSQETRSQRVNLLLRPTDVKRIKARAKRLNISMNRLIERAIVKYLED